MGTMINWQNAPFSFDAKTVEEYSEEADITDNPVEGGAVVTDHRQERPMILKIEGIVSESPFEGQAPDIGEDEVGGNRGLAALTYFRESKNFLVTWVGTRFGVVGDLLIQSVDTSVPKSQSTLFSITLKQVQFAYSTVVDLPREFRPKPPSQPLKECGRQATNDVTEVVNDAGAASLLANGDSLVGGSITDAVTNFAGLFAPGS